MLNLYIYITAILETGGVIKIKRSNLYGIMQAVFNLVSFIIVISPKEMHGKFCHQEAVWLQIHMLGRACHCHSPE